jgi:hypothetical protein
LLKLEKVRSKVIEFLKSYHPTYTLSWFDLMTHSSSLLGGRRRRYYVCIRPRRQGKNTCFRMQENGNMYLPKYKCDFCTNELYVKLISL